jgi:CheY-like chemotaxis protein
MRLTGARDLRLDGARDMIERQVRQLVRLVDDLLDVSRVSRGKIHLEKVPVDLAAVVQHAIETSRPQLEARRHELTVTLPRQPLRVEGDFIRLVQALSNLLNNAAKYTDQQGRIDLSLGTESDETGTTAVIRVRDTGRGIAPEALRNLFQLFFQGDRKLERSEGGLGVGLWLVRNLVEMHAGTVEAYSAGVGLGSEFVIRLPCIAETGSGLRPDDTAGWPKAVRPLKVLVVDDNRDSAASMAMLLDLEGHEVLLAYDGAQAVETALAERPSVVLLDIGLPKLDGYQACRAMREGGLEDALIVSMTGYGTAEDRRLSQQAGFDAHEVKPVDLRVILALLAQRAEREATAQRA